MLLCFSTFPYLPKTYSQNNSVDNIGMSQIIAQRNSTDVSNTSAVTGQGSAGDFPQGPSGFPSKAVDIAMELTQLSSAELVDYPITDLSTDEITSVFQLLNPLNLAKVLLNINQKDLVQIQNITTFDEITARLFEENKSQVQHRLSAPLPSVGKTE
jgi:hypothetical protein